MILNSGDTNKSSDTSLKSINNNIRNVRVSSSNRSIRTSSNTRTSITSVTNAPDASVPSPTLTFAAKRKRNRSNSSFSSTSSIMSLNDSYGPDGTNNNLNRSNHFMHNYGYYLSNNSNKFDINNIVIPNDMINNCKIVNIVRIQNVPTPKWRELVIEPGSTEDINSAEPLDDETLAKRHEIHELKERYHVLYKKLEKQNKDNNNNNSFNKVVSTQPT